MEEAELGDKRVANCLRSGYLWPRVKGKNTLLIVSSWLMFFPRGCCSSIIFPFVTFECPKVRAEAEPEMCLKGVRAHLWAERQPFRRVSENAAGGSI